MDPNNDLYRKLQCHIDKNMPFRFPETDSGIELDLLKHLFSPEEAVVALEISSMPESLDTIKKRLKKTKIHNSGLQNIVDRLEKKGAILGPKYWSKKGLSKGSYYSKALFVVGMYEFQAGRLSKNFGELSHTYLKETYIPEMLKNKTMQLRSIPISQSLTVENTVAPYDSIKDILSNTDRPIAVIPCVCREAKSLMGNPCKSGISETCLILNEIAEMYIEFGWARGISKIEALEIINRAEKHGFVLQPSNNQKPSHICCCCSCCCESIGNIKTVSKPSQYFHTNFYSHINSELCKGCRLCVKKCPMDAVTMRDDLAEIDPDRCIGCGVCIPTCPDKAISLRDKTKPYLPPKSTTSMYKQIMYEKYGLLGLMNMLFKYLFKIKL
ncbi:MAG: 4Fe-4S binding protein [Proteobacteria bacterium]|nr:4Fe-4S binding protein [Pseudomonadota bacterium]